MPAVKVTGYGTMPVGADLLRDDVLGLKKDYQNLQSDVGRIMQGLQSLSERFDQSRRPNWVLVIGVFGVLFGLLPAMAAGSIYIITGQIAQSIAPLSAHIGQIETADAERDHKISDMTGLNNQQSRDISTLSQQSSLNTTDIRRNTDEISKLSEAGAASSVADAGSRTDRVQLNDRVHSIESSISIGQAERRGATAEISARLLEIEQQFLAVSNIANLRWADQNRLNAMVWEKLHPGERFPTETFAPASIFQSAPSPLTVK